MLAGENELNPYLQQEVMSASPPRLRWMLINRSIELCNLTAHLWSDGRQAEADQWLLRVRDILCELLDGVQDASNPLSKTICDFYIYLMQLSLEIEKSRSHDRLMLLKELLEIEAETWRLVVARGGRELPATQEFGNGLANISSPFSALEGGSLSLEA
jgi:flagellar protein FliS